MILFRGNIIVVICRHHRHFQFILNRRENAEKLLDKKIHPTVIVKGYRLAAEQSHKILQDLALKISVDTPEGEDILRYVAMTAMTGKGAESAKEKFADIPIEGEKGKRYYQKLANNLDLFDYNKTVDSYEELF